MDRKNQLLHGKLWFIFLVLLGPVGLWLPLALLAHESPVTCGVLVVAYLAYVGIALLWLRRRPVRPKPTKTVPPLLSAAAPAVAAAEIPPPLPSEELTPAAKPAEAPPPKSHTTASWAGVWGFLLLAGLLAKNMRESTQPPYSPRARLYSSRPHTPLGPSPVGTREYPFFPLLKPLEVDHGAPTLAYWDAAVRRLHLYRFGLTGTPDEEVLAAHRRYLADYRQAAAQAETAVATGCDPEVVRMCLAHRARDAELLQLLDAIGLLAAKQQTSELTAGEAMSLMEQMTDEQISALPAELQKLLAEAAAFEETLPEWLYEIEIMQAKLNERYKPHLFLLPDLETEGF